MRHISLTCRNHPNLRWSCKEIAFTDEGGFNGARTLGFKGIFTGKLYHDGSGADCTIVLQDGTVVEECDCSSRCLVRAPEDAEIAARHTEFIEHWKAQGSKDAQV